VVIAELAAFSPTKVGMVCMALECFQVFLRPNNPGGLLDQIYNRNVLYLWTNWQHLVEKRGPEVCVAGTEALF
jgi:hypothetical protein